MATMNNKTILLPNVTVKHHMLPLGVIVPNNSTICMPLHFSVGMNYFSRQLSLSMAVAVVVNILLNRYGIPTSVCHLIAGFVLGPSVLGQIPNYREFMFPVSTSILLDSYAALAMIFQLFLIGVQVNPFMILKAGKKGVWIGTLVVIVPLLLSTTFAAALTPILDLDLETGRTVFAVATLQSVSSFPVIVFYMYELNIVSLEFSHIAYSCSMICGLLSVSLVGTTAIFFTNEFATERLASIAVHVGMVMLVLYGVRPGVTWLIKRVPEGQTVKEIYMCPVYIAVMALTLICMISRVNWLFGPFLFGVIIPSGSSLGTTLVKRFEIFNTWMMMPIYYLSHGMMIDLSRLNTQRALVTELVVLLTYVGKFLGAALPALYFNMSFNEAILLGLTVNVQGFLEISGYKILARIGIVDLESFQVMSASMIFLTVILTPLLGYLYKNTLKSKLNRRSTLVNDPNTELRVLACVFNQENVPSVIHLLKAINPTKDKPVSVSLIHFVERVGHAAPVIINHTLNSQQSSATAGSHRIINVFRSYEERNKQSISVHPYTVVAHYTSLPNDVCTLAEQQRNSLIILPYHKELSTGILNPDLRTVNCEVLDNASCSVGILIDRGLLGGIKFVHENWSSYNVVMIFIGGADDREALAQAARMSTHPTIELTLIRLIADYPNPTYSAQTEMNLDDEMIREFKLTYAYNNQIMLVEEEVEDGLGVVKLLESLEDRYELILVGRHHDPNSPLIIGLTEWNGCSEIGIVGDILTTSNYGGKSTILIVQQQKNAARHAIGSFAKDKDSVLSGYEDEAPLRTENDFNSSLSRR